MNFFSGFILLAIMMATVLAGGEVGTLRPEISVQSSLEVPEYKPVQIMDLASLNFVSPDIAKEALEIEIMPAPQEGEVKSMRNSDLIKLLKSKMAGNDTVGTMKWTFFLPDNIQIKSKRMPISYWAAENLVRQAMIRQCRDCNIKIKNLKVPNSREPIAYKDCVLQTDGVKLNGTFLLPVNCKSNTYWVSGTATITRTAPVASRHIAPGEHIAVGDFHLSDVDLTFARDGVASEKDLVGQVAARPIMLNQPIFKGDLKKEVAIFRGQSIRTLMGDENFEISTQGVAEEQGSVGDLIRVKTVENQKILSGVILEKGLVRLQ